MKLTDHQQEVFNSLILCLDKAFTSTVLEDRIIRLSGPAGVGKTTLLAEVVKHYHGSKNIKLTTPTHKSLRVAQNFISKLDIEIESSTIHSFLKLKMKPNYSNGLMDIVMDKFSKEKGKFDLVICDEFSMVDNTLYDFAIQGMKQGRMKVLLFLGDLYQLPPVTSEEPELSKVMEIQNSFELTKVVRQALDNPIIRLSNEVRKCIESGQYPDIYSIFETEENCSDSRITFFNNPKDFVTDFINNEKFFLDTAIITYTNDKVDQFNSVIKRITQPDNPFYHKGDHIILQDSNVVDDTPIHQNGDEIEILEAEKMYDSELDINYWLITDTNNKSLKTIDPEHKTKFSNIMKVIAQEVSKMEGSKKNEAWKEYFNLKAEYTDVKHSYSYTTHKSQGSSLEEVYFDIRDLPYFYKKDKDTIYRLMYVAITRASENLKILK